MFKRSRDPQDAQTKRSDYEQSLNTNQDFSGVWQSNDYKRASKETMAKRKVVSVKRIDKRHQFVKHAKSLNKTFFDWFSNQINKDKGSCLVDGAQDYLGYLNQLQDRYLRSHGEVLTFGSGDCGQLAHGTDNEEDLLVKFPRIVYSLRDKKVCMVSCGGLHNAIVTENGQVYTWGCSDDGSLGRQGDEAVPEPVTLGGISDVNIIRVSCADGQTVAVTTTGKVYAWGCFKDKEGKKWFNPESNSMTPEKTIKRQQDIPLLISGLDGVVDVACGGVFSLALLNDGTVMSWGIGECGELGRTVCKLKPSEEEGYDMKAILRDHLTPNMMCVTSDKKVSGVRAIGCGVYHSMVVVSGGAAGVLGGLYTCGLNNYGQLGLGNNDNATFLTRVTCKAMETELAGGALDTVSVVAGGTHHSCVSMASGRVFCFGRADCGQLGLKRFGSEYGGKAGDFLTIPEEIIINSSSNSFNSSSSSSSGSNKSSSNKITSVACGGSHTLALTSSGELYSWGYGDMLALGHGKDNDEPEPRKVSFSKAKLDNFSVVQVSGGGQHTAIIAKVQTLG